MPTPVPEPVPPVTAAGAGGLVTGNGTTLSGSHLFGGNGAPAASLGANGDIYLRHDTPGTSLQRVYVKAAGAWSGVV